MGNTQSSSVGGGSAKVALALLLVAAFVILLAIVWPAEVTSVAADPPTPYPDCLMGFTFSPDVGASTPTIDPALILQFRAGEWLDWRTPDATPEWHGLRQVHLVRIHQRVNPPLKHCWDSTPYLTETPYVPNWEYHWDPANTGTPAFQTAVARITAYPTGIAVAATGDPGALWLIGNEIDYTDRWCGAMHQDEMWPETYARAYKAIREYIRSIDSTAQIAPAGVVQWTPLRQQYWERVLAAYKAQNNGESMPVDWFNVHNYLLNEFQWTTTCQYTPTPPVYGTAVCSGSWTTWPTGITPNPTPTRDYETTPRCLNADVFKSQLIAFRTWLKVNGYQDKPLIISEFGGIPAVANATPSAQFMYGSVVPWMASYTDPAIGYPYDGYRLVQGWLFFSVNNDFAYKSLIRWNQLGYWELSDFGQAWVDYVSTPSNGAMGWPCQRQNTPGPRMVVGGGTPAQGGDGAGGQGAPEGEPTPTSTGMPYPPPLATPYP